MQTVTKSQLKQYISQKQDMLLINVLPKESFDKLHIPGSISIPEKGNPDFVKEVEAKAKSKNQQIVVHCANTQCATSRGAAEQLEKSGFTNVQLFKDGVDGWFDTTKAAA